MGAGCAERFTSSSARGPGRNSLGLLSRKIKARTSLLTRFRPPTCLNVETQAQYKRNPARCQFTTVLGVTRTRGFLQPDQIVLNATQNNLCREAIDGEVVARAEPPIVDEEPGFRGRGSRGSGKR
jgi:hypothetical protein